MPPLTGPLTATQDDVDDLTDILAKAKQGTKTIRVPVAAAHAVLMDYGKMLRALEADGIRIKQPK